MTARLPPCGSILTLLEQSRPDPALAAREADLLHLTPRQYEVLLLLSKGYSLKIIGQAMNISLATAKTHTEAIYHRLGVKSRNAVVYAALCRGATLGWNSPEAIPREPTAQRRPDY